MGRHLTFEGEVIEGHGGVRVVRVPFDPEEIWQIEPHRLAGRRHGWLVTGTRNGEAFDGHVGERWGNHLILVPDAAGAVVRVALRPTAAAATLAKATEQSKATSQFQHGSTSLSYFG